MTAKLQRLTQKTVSWENYNIANKNDKKRVNKLK